ncbi:unnamed protein product [Durusdinium trenchii]|uniref:Type I polyketide synthase n=1 Tax=Durusdinium trenchii TaxID=1381693 RepID=A0ABP0RPT2_9DINO
MLCRLLDAHGLARAALRGIAVNQDGRSSTMTAPNGPSQTLVVQVALAEAKMNHHEVLHMECHGTGTPLGDPIEVGALQAGSRAASLQEGRRQQSLAVSAVKTSVGHLEGAAASPGLLKTVTLLSRRSAFAVVHLYSLNPHLDPSEDVPQVFQNEHVPLGTGRRTGGLSSFGFGGTNAHGLLGESEVPVDFITLQRPPTYVKTAFPWRDAGFRLLRSQLDSNFEVSMSSDVYDIVSHHVVFGSIVTPGVVYVEMALEATRKLFGHDVALKDVTMVFPFVIPNRFAEDAGSPPIMRFMLKGDRFEIQSIANGKKTTHVEASLEFGSKSDKGSVSTNAANLNLEELQTRISELIETSVVYEAINSVGLYLGPMFQVAKKLWRKEVEDTDGCNEVLGLLQLDYPGVKNVGYILHPALLDGTIHILATASIGKNVAGLKIFGGVGKVAIVKRANFSNLERYWVHMKITESLEASQTFNVTVAADDGSVLLYMEDVVFRAVKPEQIQMAISAQGEKDDEQKYYEVEWSEEPLKRSYCRGNGLVLADTDQALGALQKLWSSDASRDVKFLTPAEVDTSSLDSYEWILCFSNSSKRDSLVDNLLFAVRLLQSLGKSHHPNFQCLILATSNTQAVRAGDMSGVFCPLHAGLWGLARAFRNENPALKVLCFDLGATQGLEELCQVPEASGDLEVALRRSCQGGDAAFVPFVPRLQEAKLESTSQWVPAGGAYIITGGLGGLGLTFASWLLERSERRAKVALISRSGKPPQDCQVAYGRLASKVSVHKADITSDAQVAQVFEAIETHYGGIKGILHAAGVLDDHMVADLQPKHVTPVLAPKTYGTLVLHDACRNSDCQFALFSSVAALLGTPAQANYSAANAFMDSFASFLRDNGQQAVSIQWGPWAEVGMAARANTSESSIVRISARKGLEAMSAILTASASLRTGIISVARIKWATLLGQLGTQAPFLSKFTVAKSTSSNVLGNYTLEDGAVEGINLTPTLMFDYPTVPDLVEYIWSQVGPAEEEGIQALQVGSFSDQLALASHSGRFPGSFSNHPGDFWHTLTYGLDTTAELPPERWDMDAFYDSDFDAPGKTYLRLGHFIPGIEQFDGEFFGLSEMEQRGMDPHQWLTLEITYDCMFASGLTKESMNALECGVYVGCATLGGIEPNIPAFGPFTNIGYAYSGLSGRVSHTLSLRGPCFTVDTACSATVVALDCASQAIRLGRCKSAAASGVNLQLSAAIWVGFAKMRGLAMDGNCKTFDTSADGFARGEGMGHGESCVLLLQSGELCRRITKTIIHKSSGLTPHKGFADCASFPTCKVGGQSAVYGKSRGSFLLAAGKTNLGHLEGAAGVAGISKAVLSCQRAQVPALLWLRQLNNNIELSGFSAAMPTELLAWRREKKISSVSSFGFSGTNGHALVEEAEVSAPPPRAKYARRMLQAYHMWMQDFSFQEVLIPVELSTMDSHFGCKPSED